VADESDPLDEMGSRFEVALLEAQAAQRPDDLAALRALAYAYSAAGRHQDALRADVRLVAMAPEDPGLRYDLACSLALVGRPDDALDELDRAVRLGFRERELLLADADLDSIRTHPRFALLLARL